MRQARRGCPKYGLRSGFGGGGQSISLQLAAHNGGLTPFVRAFCCIRRPPSSDLRKCIKIAEEPKLEDRTQLSYPNNTELTASRTLTD